MFSFLLSSPSFINSFDLILKKGKNKNIYNIGNEQEISIKNLVKKIKKTVAIKNKVINIDNHKGSPNRRCPDNTKLVKLGYKMSIDLNKGLYLTNEWYKSLK